MPKPVVDWTETNTETLTRMWNAGAPCSEIIGRIGAEGLTRSAVVGKAHRLGLPKRRRAVVSENTRLIGKRVGGNNRPSNAKFKPKVAAESAGAKEPKIWDNRQEGDVATIFRTEDLKSFDCRWPIGDPHQPGFGYCGAKCAEIFGYCEVHAARAFNPNTPKMRYDKRLV